MLKVEGHAEIIFRPVQPVEVPRPALAQLNSVEEMEPTPVVRAVVVVRPLAQLRLGTLRSISTGPPHLPEEEMEATDAMGMEMAFRAMCQEAAAGGRNVQVALKMVAMVLTVK